VDYRAPACVEPVDRQLPVNCPGQRDERLQPAGRGQDEPLAGERGPDTAQRRYPGREVTDAESA
jgi:hypothetical protein